MITCYKFIVPLCFIFFFSCNNAETHKTKDIDTNDSMSKEANDSISKEAFIKVMKTHLDAVSNKDLPTLESTLSPSGKMQLLLPKTEITNTTDEFIAYHRAWFKDTTWTFTTKILDTTIGETLGLAIVEILYSEPDRDGGPYYNRMYVSYTLEKQDGSWYVIKDHASSIEKSTDEK